MRFGEKLRQHRKRKHWTQQQLADMMGKSKNNISQYELGKRQPNLDQLMRFADVFQVTIDELLGREDA